ncbi:hypothetical protein C8J57DRAFT_1476331 [Mycena rebaudengoi]|nr:hypothetical protein C8J57DRAFT_1476331 [Mycena rebaudengoi]
MRQPSTRPEVYALASRHSRVRAARTPCGSPCSPTSLPLRLPRTADASARAELIALKSALLSKPALATAQSASLLMPLSGDQLPYERLAHAAACGAGERAGHVQGALSAAATPHADRSLRRLPWRTQEQASHVRLYRDCSVADLLFTTLLTLLAVTSPSRPSPSPRRSPPSSQPFSSTSSPESSSSSAYARRSDGAGAASTSPLRLACDQPELAGLAAPGEACKRWLERAAVSISASMVVRVRLRLPSRIPIRTNSRLSYTSSSPSRHSTRTCCACPLRSHPSSDGTDAEHGAAPLSTLSTAARIRILPLPAHVGVLVASVHGAVCDKSMHHGEKKEEASSLVSRTTERDEYTSYTGARCVQERGDCWDMRDCRDTRDGREGRESREGQADARLLPAGVVRAKWKWL